MQFEKLRIGAVALLLTSVITGPANLMAQEETMVDLRCEFGSGTSWSYENGGFKAAVPSPLTFEIRAIKLEAQTAQLITPQDKEPGALRVVRAINANHFLEVVNEGFLNLTTVYDADPESGAHPAVHSRHFGILGSPVFAQYTGLCRTK